MATAEPVIQLFDGAEIWQVPTLDASVEAANGKTSVIVCGETRPFRFLAKHLRFSPSTAAVEREMDIVELGCSSGETTVYLNRRFRKVVGVDISAEMIGKPAGPGLDLRLMDVLADVDQLDRLLAEEFNAGAGCSFFIDIGGDRMQDTVLLLLTYVMQRYKPLFIVLKCRKLYRTLLPTSAHELLAQWEESLKQARVNAREDRMRLHPKRFGLALVPGNSEQAICRYHNYKHCAKQDECPHDHSHCHYCKEKGHRAKDCTLFANELLLVRKA